MIVLDRENLFARGWSHAVSTTHDMAELEAFRRAVGAPPRALQLGNAHWPHLDLTGEARARALASPHAMIVDTTRDLIRFVRRWRTVSS